MNAQEKWVGSKSLALLRQGPFRRYIIGSLISDSGTWMQMMAQSWVMSGLTSKAILLGLVNFAAGLPALILAPVAGSLADRLDKRKILVATQIAQIIFAVALGFLVMSGQSASGTLFSLRCSWGLLSLTKCRLSVRLCRSW